MKINRRSFFRRLLMILAAIEVLFLIKKGISKKSGLNKQKDLINIGKADSFEKGRTYPFISDRFYIKRFEDGGFLALSVKCTHLGCVVNQNTETGGFNCPCHASQFNKYGEVTASPATRPLDIYPMQIIKGEIYVDVNMPQTRTSFEKSQLTYLS